ncbi:MAG TPA: acyl-CoA dehydrogenase family protein [Syntrophales bacterium]|nr:acyl-CoA dehydrogenase family protein [Syntrophales bacterium]HOX95270.1 acyl-CoA dehydrogenase family protein [Syntrophales bacterium]HPI58473.1 acyl-CoA dehydrogenase family protein [Syntrophales bacterium]HPN25609.1 acyl-CoA dehydrogenase family protein [Syntrophales bacterium]HQM28133.1 acyl-CoA dehydrogenase family protein [Syntrophales bacterium]
MFEFTKEQEMLRAMVREFAEKELAPRALDIDKKGEFPADLFKKIAGLGLLGISTPKELGGSEMGHLAATIATEEVARVYPSAAFFLEVGTGPLYALANFGSADQKKKYIPPVISGAKRMCIAATEPSGGSDLTTMQTEAVAAGDSYVINGRKVYITSGGASDYCLLLAKTGERASFFVVEKGTPGFIVGRRQDQMGLKGVDVSELVFTDCKVPKDAVIGKEGAGFPIAITTFTVARPSIGALGLGIARGAFDIALRYAKERVLYGKPIARLQAVQFMLAEMDTEIDAARWLVYQPCAILDRGGTPRDIVKSSARSKAAGAEVALSVVRKAIEILGGYGVSPEYHLARLMNDAMELFPATGTNQIMKIIQAGEILK